MNTRSLRTSIVAFLLGMLCLGAIVWANQEVLTYQQRLIHMLNRIGYGPRPGDMAQVTEIGTERYIQQQLNPHSLSYSSDLKQQLEALSTRKLSPIELYQQYGPPLKKQAKALKQSQSNVEVSQKSAQLKEIQQKIRQVMLETSQARLLRAVNSPRQLEEVMTDFWFNHFNVYAGKGATYVWVGNYEDQAIRPHVFGRFRDLLAATAKHPAMLFYLDNWLNTAPGTQGAKGKQTGLNENYARELLELHTLGVDGGYTQKDVTELARVLTGWGLVNRQAIKQQLQAGNSASLPRMQATGQRLVNKDGVYFDAKRHDFGDKIILGQTIKGSGESELETVLDLLAHHPATAHHISYKLAQYFVSDKPSDALVETLSKQYLASDGNIRQVLATLFKSPEFWSYNAYQNKFKNPYQYMVSLMRVTGVKTIDNPQYVLGQLRNAGMPLYGSQPPTGYKYTTDAWLSPDAMAQRTSLATSVGAGRFPVSKQPVSVTKEGLADTLGVPFSENTQKAIDASPVKLQPALILGSPEFLRY